MYQTKAATHSVGVVSQVVAIFMMSMKLVGVDISADVANVPENIGNVIDATMILVAQLTALWGRLRADKKIRGIFSAK